VIGMVDGALGKVGAPVLILEMAGFPFRPLPRCCDRCTPRRSGMIIVNRARRPPGPMCRAPPPHRITLLRERECGSAGSHALLHANPIFVR